MRPTIPLLALALLVSGCAAALIGVTPPGTAKLEFRLIAATEAEGVKVATWDGKAFMFVERQAPLTEKDVAQMKLSKLPDGTPAIDLQLDQTATITLESITTKNVGRRLAILVDGKIVIAPTIKESIAIGRMSVTGATPADTQAIYARLKK